ncbi:NAD(P)H-dependent oxidoreductase [Noviherbaspirillum sp. DKR-6]|uniref:NAD(P)H-dependent oxidoreductase n=1 Tax=Noviherbaspirillum pedocola TaxID=2801341 RepID=A0A934SS32_9BURK|nr:NAD(P)H-dependent oxidoreductase [Noviherbaspirillum pedocola]
MGRRVLLIQGHPDNGERHYLHALADAYADGAREGGAELRLITVAELNFPLLHSQKEWEHEACPQALLAAQDALRWSDHLVILYPMWLGEMPALMKGFLEQVLRPGFAFDAAGARAAKPLAGRSARVVVSMGMPAPVYRWFFRAHSLKSLERNVLRFVGIGPVRSTLIGSVETQGDEGRARWLKRMHDLGRRAR